MDDAGDAVVGEVAHLGQPLAHLGHRREQRRARVGEPEHPGTGRRPVGVAAGATAGVAAPGSPPHLPVAVDDVLHARELAQPHGAAGVELLGGDADLGAEAELGAVDEAGGGVDDDGGGVDLAAEPLGGAQVAR